MSAALFKFALAALLAVWPAAVQSPHYPGPKVDAPTVAMTPQTSDMDILAYCYGTPMTATVPATERRVCRIAREVSGVVAEHASQNRIPFAGPVAAQATVLALLEIARHESGFRSKVEDCRITGDPATKWALPSEGLAISLFQLQSNNHEDLFEMTKTKPPRHRRYSREAICKSNELAAMLALHTLMRKAWTVDKTTHPKSVASMFYLYSSGKGTPSKAGRQHVEAFEMMMRQNGLVMVLKNGPMWAEEKP